MRKSRLIIIVLVFVLSNNCFGQQNDNELNKKITNIFTELYHFQLSEYDRDINLLKADNIPDNQYYYLKANLQWWHILNGANDEKSQDLCLKYIDKSIESYSENPSLENRLTLLSAYILKMRVNNYGNHKLKSVNSILKILDLSDGLINEIEEDEQKLFVKGICHYFTNYAKEESVFAKVLLFGYSNESKEKGLEYLEQATHAKNTVIRTEARYLLYKIYSTLENDMQKALNNAEWLYRAYPENIFYQSNYYLTLCRTNKHDEAQIMKNSLLQQVTTTSELNEKEKQHYYKLVKQCKTN